MQVTRQTLDANWRVREVPPARVPPHNHLPWLPAQVPGHVHLDLVRAGIIPDPFARMHERAVAWVDESDWVYETTFTVDDPVPAHAYLVFNGLDTIAEIMLNGEELGQTDNMYIPHEFPVGGRLQAGENHLQVTFRSALRVGRERQEAWNASEDTTAGHWDAWDARSFVRKAQYMFGWDWGPVLRSCGLWRPVELVTVPVARILDWKYDVEFTDDGKAVVTVEAEVEHAPASADMPLSLTAELSGVGFMEGNTILRRMPAPVSAAISKGSNHVSVTLTIDKPLRWFPIGYNTETMFDGSHPPLYTLELSLDNKTDRNITFRPGTPEDVRMGDILMAQGSLNEEQLRVVRGVQESAPGDLGRIAQDLEFASVLAVDTARHRVFEEEHVFIGEILDTKTAKFGLRTIELIQELDADGQGECFKLRVNGVDIFAKGANWIPEDSFPSRLENEPDLASCTPLDDKVAQVVEAACDAGFNMLRIWGGGLYESEHFYELCDEHGLLVWQDFPHACAYYPDTDEYAEAAKKEATAAVRRIRHHPSLALWCGNNENDQMYYDNWTGDKPTRYLGDKLYREIYPAIIKAEDPKTPYWPSSPSGGDNPNSEDFGDCHNWDVWHGRGDWKHYTANDSRFCSEFGFASSCSLTAWDKVLAPEDKHPLSPVVRWHEKTRKGYDTYLGYIGLHYPDPQTLEDLVYFSQINQAEALKHGIEHYRRRKGRCWGTLFWQLNDCWPVQSWAIIDSEGQPKAAWYWAKKFYAPVLLSLYQRDGQIEVHLVSDLLRPLSGKLTLSVETFDGGVVQTQTVDASVEANSAAQVFALGIDALAGQEREAYVYARFEAEEGAIIAENILLLAEPKDLRLPDPGLTVTVTEREGNFVVTLTARRFAPYVWLRLRDNAPLFWGQDGADNFFHLRAGETREIMVAQSEVIKSVEDLRGRLMVRTL